MRVSAVVATYGSPEWEAAGRAALTAVQGDPCWHDTVGVHMPGGTLAQARNLGAERATGDWLCFVDADDGVAAGYLGSMEVAYTRWLTMFPGDGPEPPRPLLVPAVAWQNERGGVFTLAGIPAWDRPLIDVNCAVIGTLIPRALFLEVGGFRDQLADGDLLPALEDWELWLRAVKAGACMVPVPQAVYVARAGGSGRNADQSPYWRIRNEHGGGFDWWSTGAYKAA